ncbi:MAG: hypothetical protein A2X61_03475 [Ignavibacteria bacterium GWB2_35_12]|nr:MAG: hypothetical protein A2X63_10150 [Ignavibacteria bacterium GWA2_35_8]OGU42100.1 MAG: hypothetical protein A2X61_03475 [Ignavibacteria bacterium GWB2_35_12]OGU95582.1 MAG: hypothetical protein A2220_06425 [Ignavibacteria bacterium RIFOXYA2_FULL_35_10]OGV20250.1 MAG: hypothetical protein A2475_07870 [Ignavibacteria bacterium RIFOXYC2_FULL_35_21]
MYSTEDIEQLKDMIISIVPDACRVYLFGSYSRGTADVHSDLDIAIITEGQLERKAKLNLLSDLWNATCEQGYSIDFILKPLDDFEDEKDLPTLSKVINTEGKLLWQRI